MRRVRQKAAHERQKEFSTSGARRRQQRIVKFCKRVCLVRVNLPISDHISLDVINETRRTSHKYGNLDTKILSQLPSSSTCLSFPSKD